MFEKINPQLFQLNLISKGSWSKGDLFSKYLQVFTMKSTNARYQEKGTKGGCHQDSLV